MFWEYATAAGGDQAPADRIAPGFAAPRPVRWTRYVPSMGLSWMQSRFNLPGLVQPWGGTWLH